jgi:hypothetical protein
MGRPQRLPAEVLLDFRLLEGVLDRPDFLLRDPFVGRDQLFSRCLAKRLEASNGVDRARRAGVLGLQKDERLLVIPLDRDGVVTEEFVVEVLRMSNIDEITGRTQVGGAHAAPPRIAPLPDAMGLNLRIHARGGI